jgi:hypothetical protein
MKQYKVVAGETLDGLERIVNIHANQKWTPVTAPSKKGLCIYTQVLARVVHKGMPHTIFDFDGIGGSKIRE